MINTIFKNNSDQTKNQSSDGQNAGSLIGRYVLRTKPVVYQNGLKDWSYSSDILKVISVIPKGTIVAHDKHTGRIILDSRWNDNGWREVSCEEMPETCSKKTLEVFLRKFGAKGYSHDHDLPDFY